LASELLYQPARKNGGDDSMADRPVEKLVGSELGGRILRELVEDKGFEAPMVCACKAANGRFFVLRWTAAKDFAGFDTEVLFDAGPPQGMRLPLTVTIVDSQGKGAAFVLDLSGEKKSLH
jgi:hypothetical protein